MIDRLREFAEAARRHGSRQWADLSDELLALLDETDEDLAAYRRIMEKVDEVGPKRCGDEESALRVVERYGEFRATMIDVERFDPSDEEKPGEVEAFVRQADADAIFRYDVRGVLVAFGALDKADKETDPLAMLRALLGV